MTDFNAAPIYQSSSQILSVLERAETTHSKLTIGSDGGVKIANFGTRFAEFFKGVGKGSDWRAQRQIDLSQAVFEKLSEAVEREFNDRVSTSRESKVALDVISSVFGRGQLRNDVDAGRLPVVAHFRAALADAELEAVNSLTTRDHTMNEKTRNMLKDGRMDTFVTNFLKAGNDAGNMRVGLFKRLESLRSEFEILQNEYANLENPTDEDAAKLRDFTNDLIKFEGIVEKALKDDRVLNADQWVGTTVTVPERAIGREVFSTRGEFRRAVESELALLSELHALIEGVPGLQSIAQHVDAFLTQASEMGEVHNTALQHTLLDCVASLKNDVGQTGFDMQFDGELDAGDFAAYRSVESKIVDLGNLLAGSASQQVRFVPQSALDIGSVPADGAGRFGIHHSYLGARSSETTQKTDSYVEQATSYKDHASSQSDYAQISKNRKQGIGDYGRQDYREQKFQELNTQWSNAIAAEPTADRSQYKPSDERFVRGDISELNVSDDAIDNVVPEVTFDTSDAPARSALKRS